jgi:hypothetical protein
MFSRVQIDVSGPFPTSRRQNKLIITATDYISKWVEARAVRRADTDTLVKFFIEQIICRHSVPKIVQSDNGSIFTSDFFKEVTKQLGIKQHLSTAYHPKSQGQVERTHAVINDCISMFVKNNQSDWCEKLHLIIFAINTSVSETTGYSAFFLIYGREAVLPIEAQFTESQFVDLEKLLTSLQSARVCARENIEIGQIRSASYHDLKVREHSFKVGDIVVCRKFVRKRGISPKLALQYYYGPYTIVQMPTEVTAIIEATNKTGKSHKERVHVEKLKIYHPRNPNELHIAILPDEPPIQPTEAEHQGDPHNHLLSMPLDNDTDEQALLPDQPNTDATASVQLVDEQTEDEQITEDLPLVTTIEQSDQEIISSPVASPRYSLRRRPAVNYKE